MVTFSFGAHASLAVYAGFFFSTQSGPRMVHITWDNGVRLLHSVLSSLSLPRNRRISSNLRSPPCRLLTRRLGMSIFVTATFRSAHFYTSAMLLGTWINMMLYMLEIVQVSRLSGIMFYDADRSSQAIRIYRNYPNDPIGLKLAVAGAFVVDTVCTMAACATVYMVRDPDSKN
jgi:hypothetical protein